MNSRITFEAKYEGAEAVNKMLEQQTTLLNSLSDASIKMSEAMSKSFGDFHTTLESLTKTQGGTNNLTKTFEEATKATGDFIGKSYKGVSDTIKNETKLAEDSLLKIKGTLKDVHNEINRINSPAGGIPSAASMGSARNLSPNLLNNLQSANFPSYGSNGIGGAPPPQVPGVPPSGGGFGSMLSGMGMRQFSALAGIPMAIGAGLTGYGDASIRQDFTKEVDSYLAQRRLTLGAAASAQKGDITVSLLKQLGEGLENKIPNSTDYKSKLAGQQIVNNPWAQALTGAVLGAGGGTLFGGPLGALIGGVGGFATGLIRGYSNEKTKEQIDAENKAGYRSRDSELYGIAGDEAGQNLKRESTELSRSQRAFGMEATHRTVMGLSANGVSMDRGNPILNMMISQGLNPGDFTGSYTRAGGRGGGGRGTETYNVSDLSDFVKASNVYGFSDKATQAAIRSQGLTGGGLGSQTNSMLSVMAGAGLTSASSIAARGTFSDAVADMQSQRGGTSATAAEAGGPLAAAIGANKAGFNQVEGVQQGISLYNTVQQQTNKGGSLMDMLTVGKLRSLGVSSSVAIDMFMKAGIDQHATRQAIAKYVQKDIKEVDAALGGIAAMQIGALETVLGKGELNKLSSAFGKDVTTLAATGNVKAFDNTEMINGTRGATYSEVLTASKSGKSGVGDISSVIPGAETQQDLEDKAKAQKQVTTDDALKAMLQETGKTVTAAISQSIIDGFMTTAKEVEKVGLRFQQNKTDDIATTKQQSVNAQQSKDLHLGPDKRSKL